MWLTEDEILTDDGRRLTFGIPHKHPFALIIPWDGDRLTLVGQCRYMVTGYSWEFPQGHFEHKSIIETAKAELKEETGLVAGSLKEVGFFWVGPGAIDQECRVFIATNLKRESRDLEQSEEGMDMKAVTPGEFWTMVRTGEIKDGPTLAAISMTQRIPSLSSFWI